MASQLPPTSVQNKEFTFALVGNPNSGKTTLFNKLTGSRQSVGNWPGVTVEQKIGYFQCGGQRVKLVDLPGIYSIDVIDESLSIDERITRDYLITERPDVVINIIDASNLERNLYLTTEILDTGIPMIIALNMTDILKQRKIDLDLPTIAETFSCPIVPIVASKGKGIPDLIERFSMMMEETGKRCKGITYPDAVEAAIAQLQPSLEKLELTPEVDPRWHALRLLDHDALARRLAPDSVLEMLPEIQANLQETLSEALSIVVADARYRFIQGLAKRTLHRRNLLSKHRTDLIDRWVLHRWLGGPIFLLVMYALFFITTAGSEFFIDYFDRVSEAIFVDGFALLLTQLGLSEAIVFTLAHGIGGGVQVVATFIPVVTTLFLGLSILEGTGYMARGAFVLDRSMRKIGLPGRAFVPLLMGFGCTVPAVLATRTLSEPRDRLLTMFLTPFMSCGAKLPVYALFAAAFFPRYAATVIFGLYLFGVVVAILTGLIIKNRLLPGSSPLFFIELPTYHIPTLRNIVVPTWHRLSSFIWGAGKIIVPMVLILNVLNSVTLDGKIDLEGDSEDSLLSFVGKQITPLLSGFGIEEDNWPASVGIFTGLLAKEATVGTLEALYSSIDSKKAVAASATDLEEDTQEAETGLNDILAEIGEATRELFASLPTLGEFLLDPIDIEGSIAEATEASDETFSAMYSRFRGASGALAYLIFMLLYAPCAAAVGAIYRESSRRWALFTVLWSTGVAYGAATLFYQVAHFSAHPLRSASWIGAILVASIATWIALGWYGKRLPEVASPSNQ